jgi:5'-nucleotidase
VGQFPIDEKFVVAVASSALFDLTESDRVFRERGEDAYRQYQRDHEEDVLSPGVAFPFVRRLLSLNGPGADDRPVEVILLSRNDPDTGLRVFNSIAHHKLAISRGAFVTGRRPYRYMPAFNASLFLSANELDVRAAVNDGWPAGQVLGLGLADDPTDPELRIAFDFDGVLASDTAEQVHQARGLEDFLEHEQAHGPLPLEPGPLQRLLGEMARLQRLERERAHRDPNYEPRIRTAIVTSRNAPAHRRLVTTLRSWGITVDETLLLGGMAKNRVLEIFRPHIFFDDQLTHAVPAASVAPSVHVPFGISNRG